MAELVAVAIIEDHPLVQASMHNVCESLPNWHVVHVGDSLQAFLDAAISCAVVILDLELRGQMVLFDDVQRLVESGPSVLIVSALSSPSQVRKLLATGVKGFVSKLESQEILVSALQAAASGEHWTSSDLAAILERGPDRPALSEQEQRALTLYASGLKLQSVARIMNVKPSTVKEYIERVRVKYEALGRHAPTKIHLARNAEQDGYL